MRVRSLVSGTADRLVDEYLLASLGQVKVTRLPLNAAIAKWRPVAADTRTNGKPYDICSYIHTYASLLGIHYKSYS